VFVKMLLQSAAEIVDVLNAITDCGGALTGMTGSPPADIENGDPPTPFAEPA
jgi:hypothetical protein